MEADDGSADAERTRRRNFLLNVAAFISATVLFLSNNDMSLTQAIQTVSYYDMNSQLGVSNVENVLQLLMNNNDQQLVEAEQRME